MSKKQPEIIIAQIPKQWFHRSEVQRLLDNQDRISNLFFGLIKYADAIVGATRSIYASLIFSDSLNWATGLKRLQDDYNSKVTSAIQAIKQAALLEPDGQLAFESMENQVLADAALVNTAINDSIGSNDHTALWDLSEHIPDLSEILREHLESFKTDAIALDRRFARAKVYIGHRCNEMDNGKIGIEAMWRAIWRDLNRRRHRLQSEDEKEAWEYFKVEKPLDMTPIQRRAFNQQISSFKQDMKPYSEKSRQSADKPE